MRLQVVGDVVIGRIGSTQGIETCLRVPGFESTRRRFRCANGALTPTDSHHRGLLTTGAPHAGATRNRLAHLQ